MSAHLGLWEREAALAAVDSVLQRARLGQGGALFMAADAGIGKSVLLAEAGHRGAGFRLGLGRGDDAEAALPYGILHQALSALDPTSPLSGFDPAASVTDARATLFYAVVRWLGEIATQPVLLLLDDLQWADADSLALLGVICRRISTLPVAIIGTMRPFPTSAVEMARSLSAGGFAGFERLQPLSAEATADLLVARRGEDIAGEVVDRAWQLTAGNPLLIEQAVAMLARDGALPEPDGGGGGHELLVGRFAGVGEDALRFAQAASVLGVRFRATVAAQLVGLGDPDIDAPLEALSRAGIITVGSHGSTEFVHPLFCSALYDGIGAALRSRWHGRAFALLHAAGTGDAEAADQARRSDLNGDRTAIAVLVSAGRDAIRAGAGVAAERHFRAAARLAGDSAAADVRLGLAEALLLTGQCAEAVAVAGAVEASGELDPAAQADALRMLGRANFYAGALTESSRRYDAAVAASVARDDPATAAEVALEYAAVALFAAGPPVSLPVAERARSLVAGETLAVGAAADLCWALNATLGGRGDAIEVAAAAAERLVRDNTVERAASLAFFGAAATMAERFEDADSTLSTARQWGERGGDPVILSSISTATAINALRRGRLHDALDAAERAVALGDIGPAGVSWAAGVAGEVLLQLNRVPESVAMADLAVTLAEERLEWLPLLWTRLTSMQRLLGDGRALEAAAEADWLEAAAARYGIVEPCFVPWAGEALAAHAAAGNFESVARLTATLDAAAAALPCVWPGAAAARGHALLHEHEGAAGAAVGTLEAALSDERLAALPLERLRICLDHGRLLRRNGNVASARAILGDVARDAEAIGAAWLAGLATAELHVAGGRRRRRGAADELTAAERRVAALAAAGLSNAEIASQLFVSAKTVDTHLQHIYAKIGINSRRELIRLRAGAEAQAD